TPPAKPTVDAAQICGVTVMPVPCASAAVRQPSVAAIQVLHLRLAVDIVASGLGDECRARPAPGQGRLHIEPGLEARGLRGRRAHADLAPLSTIGDVKTLAT